MRLPVEDRAVKIWREWRGLLLTLLILTAVRSAIADWNDVPSGSMNPTIVEGDRVFVNKLAYDLKIPFTTRHIAQWSNPKRGDIVVFFSPAGRHPAWSRRVIGLPGDSIEMVNEHGCSSMAFRRFMNHCPRAPEVTFHRRGFGPRLFANETRPSKCPIHAVTILPRVPAKRTFGLIDVPPGHYFMMGDNRDDSNDSRYWGTVDRGNSLSDARRWSMMSLDHEHYLEPRWHRFFSALL